MQVNAIYEDGAINLTTHLRFKHRKFGVIVNIPEAEIDEPTQSSKAVPEAVGESLENTPGESFLAKIKQILGPDFHPRPASTVAQDKATLLEALEERYNR
jgi:hypothetical protein